MLFKEGVMKNLRIIKRTHVDGFVMYVLQRRYRFWPWWHDTWASSPDIESVRDAFRYFDGTEIKEEIVE